MMLTPEQLYELRARADYPHVPTFGADLRRILDHIDAQQARIAELEPDAMLWLDHVSKWRRITEAAGKCVTPHNANLEGGA